LEAVEPLEEEAAVEAVTEEAAVREVAVVVSDLAAVLEAEAELVSEGEAVAGSLGAVVEAFPAEVAGPRPI
jgi:hypothetical protein